MSNAVHVQVHAAETTKCFLSAVSTVNLCVCVPFSNVTVLQEHISRRQVIDEKIN